MSEQGWRRKLWLIMKLYRVPVLAMSRYGTWYGAWQLWLSLWHDADTHWFRRLIVRAAPTCTLWRPHYYSDVCVFVLWPRLHVTGLEMAEIG